jgi:hypothetical protein
MSEVGRQDDGRMRFTAAVLLKPLNSAARGNSSLVFSYSGHYRRENLLFLRRHARRSHPHWFASDAGRSAEIRIIELVLE